MIMENEPHINIYLRQMLDMGGSDLHLSINFPPKARIHGNIVPLTDEILTPEYMELLMREICLPAKRWDMFMERRDLDFAHEIPGVARFRCNFMYNYHGMACVLRQIPSKILTLDELKLPEVLKEICTYKSGLVLVTGPTGSGKSTTLYTALKELNKPSVNIITVEDPVESPVKDINQVQVNSQVGLDFSAALRSILRHDPDIIFIGEIRDNETAQIAVRSSITGHLVLSTLHTNDALSAIMRLCDMGIEKYLVTSSLSGVVAQRLLKRVCPECSVDHKITEDESKMTGLPVGTVTKVGRGCMNCGNTGYSGRIAIYEFVLITKELRKAILEGVTMDELYDIAKGQGMISLKDSCKELLLNGITSCKEAVRVIYAKE